MQRTEEIFSKDIHFKTRDPFSLSLEILRISREFGEPVEKKNIYETDGPRKRVELSFELKKEIDKFTTSKLTFDLTGESNSEGFLDARFKGELLTSMKRAGPITRTFNDYYTSEILPFMKREFVRLEDTGNEIEKRINSLKALKSI